MLIILLAFCNIVVVLFEFEISKLLFAYLKLLQSRGRSYAFGS